MRTAIYRIFVAVLGLSAIGEVRADGVLYELRPGSVLVNSCKCGRRAIEFPIEGTFVLTAGAQGVDSRSYDISAVDFHATSGSTDVSITGTGKYNIVFPSIQSLVLDLDIAGETGIHFESDASGNAQTWPFLDMSVTEMPGSLTRIYSLRIIAEPKGTEEVAYTLEKGSTFTNDCPICAHVVIPVPISGTFTLTKVDQNSLNTTYRVDGIEFKDTAGDQGLHITGFGHYVIGGDFALTHTMHLDLDVTLGTEERTATLESPMVPVTGLPNLDVSLDEVNPASLGSVFRLHIIASPGKSPAPKFRRGDANDDGSEDLSDAVFALGWLFLGETTPTCQDAVDVNDDGRIDLSDPVALLSWLFLSGDPPPAPGPKNCGLDTTPSPDITAPCVSRSCN